MSSGKDESISAIGGDDLDSIPEYLRAGIQKIIEKRVAQRVDEEMKVFKEEIRAELIDQQAVN